MICRCDTEAVVPIHSQAVTQDLAGKSETSKKESKSMINRNYGVDSDSDPDFEPAIGDGTHWIGIGEVLSVVVKVGLGINSHVANVYCDLQKTESCRKSLLP